MTIHSNHYLAKKEFWLSFKFFSINKEENGLRNRILPNKPYPGGRDFLSLCMLLSLLLVIGFSTFLVYQGFDKKLMDIMLGKVSDAGTPVWVKTPIGMSKTPRIDEGMIAAFKQQVGQQPLDFSIHPHITASHIGFTSYKIWLKTEDQDKFTGLALLADDPLWNSLAVSEPKVSTHLYFFSNLSLFKEHFNLKIYRDSLSGKIPQALLDEIPIPANNKEGFASEEELKKIKKLWLYVGSENDGNLLPIPVVWKERFPVPKNYAFLMPMELETALTALSNNSFNYFPESEVMPGQRIKSISFKIKQSDYKDDKITAFFNCLSTTKPDSLNITSSDGLDTLQITLDMAKPNFWIDACIKPLNVNYEIKQIEYGKTVEISQTEKIVNCKEWFQWSNNSANTCKNNPKQIIHVVNLPCDVVKNDLKTSEEIKTCQSSKDHKVSFPLFSFTDDELKNGIYAKQSKDAFVYIKNRDQIDAVLKLIDSFYKKPIIISETYKYTLKRFGFLTHYLTDLGPIILYSVIGLSSIILFLQIYTTIGHRKHFYGIFLAKGLSIFDICSIILWQMLYCIIWSSVFSALTVYFLITPYLDKILDKLIENNKDIVSLDSSVFSLPFENFFCGLGIGATILLLITLFTIYISLFFAFNRCLFRNPSPSDLFKVS